MRAAHPLERAIGMRYYASDVDGTGGHLREAPEDFRVRERETVEPEPIDADEHAYPHLLARVTLTSWDTNDFAGTLSDHLGISRERISWAGTKDKAAVTTQLISVADADPDALGSVSLSGADIDIIGRTGRPLYFGDLAGNDFEITVRDLAHPENADTITASLQTFATGAERAPDAARPAFPVTVGVPNYFGHQRFGSLRPVTHEVGLEIVREDWEAAVRTYVGNPSEREPAVTRAARSYLEETDDWAGTLDRLPERLGYERAMCHRVVEAGADRDADTFRRAIEAVPTNLQRLFVNAAQSYAYNRMLSARLERDLPFHEPVVGDVVCFAAADGPADFTVPDTDRTQRVTASRLETVRRHCERGRAFVTAPLVGTDTALGDGEPGEIERTVLADLDLDPEDFALPGAFDSTGTRRAILLRTDLTVERHAGNDALTVAFALPKGSYATVLLREYLKTDPADL